jgi:predicted RNA-binding Zn-ribbon protein involved in translation (DUF1610 family)
MKIRHLNRIKDKQANKSKFYCYNCDGALVGEFGKCPSCGKNKIKRRLNKKV